MLILLIIFQREKTIEIFYLLGKKDSKIYNWLFNSINDTFDDSSNSSASFLISLELLKALSQLIAKDAALNDFELVEKMLSLCSEFLNTLDLTKTSLGFLLNFFNALAVIIQNFSANRSIMDTVTAIDLIVSRILAIVSGHYDKLVLAANETQSGYEIFMRLSFIFRIYASK